MGSDFYKNLRSFNDISSLTSEQHYESIPDDWIIVVTDIRNSTSKIQGGQYKEVNTTGASCIITVSNALRPTEFPYIFGGDGATLIIPPSEQIKAAEALFLTKQKAKAEFDADLRICFVPMKKVLDANLDIKVAKFSPSPNNSIAMFIGGGVSYAEGLMKKHEKDFPPPEVSAKGSFEGLECRWDPINSAFDGMLTIIVENRTGNIDFLQSLFQQIQQIAPSSQPITPEKLKVSSRPTFLSLESKLKSNRFTRFFYVLKVKLWLSLILNLVKKNQLNLNHQVGRYISQLATNTDYIKMDDSLRMILDLTAVQKKSILETLENAQNMRKIYYGTHWSKHALMTCFVQNDQEHMHFVDGSDGGYNLAATQLKATKALGNV